MISYVDMKMHFRKYGAGRPIIILHGILGNGDNWTSLSRKLAGKYEVYVPDFRNHGLSPHSDQFSLDVLKEDVFRFMEDHHIIKPIVIGHSLGGKVAMHMAFDQPARLAALVIIDIGMRHISPFKDQLALLNTIIAIDPSGFVSRNELEYVIAQRIKIRRLQKFLLKNLRRTAKKQFEWKVNAGYIKQNLDKVLVDVEPKNPFNQPVLLIKGGESPYLPDEEIILMSQTFSDLNLEIIESASHWVHADQPCEFYQCLKNFLEDIQ